MINFIGKRKIYYIIAAVSMAAIGLFALIFGVPMDIQFKGGSMITYSYTGDISIDEISSVAQGVVGACNVQESEDVTTGIRSFVITVAELEGLSTEEHEALTAALVSSFADNAIRVEETDNVDASMGKEFFAKCLVAMAFACVLMVIYVAIRFRKIGGWSAGTMCVLALLHDMIWVFGAFLFARIPLNDNFIAAALTILGYSINNTIIIYDRIRENKRIMGGNTALDYLVNVSVNQTLSRSVMTTVAVVLALLCVLVVALLNGLESIISFVYPMLVGMVAGLFSSVCLAPAMWVSWKERSAKKA